MTFIWRAGMGFAAHSRHTRPFELPWLSDTGQTYPTEPRQPLGQRRFQSSRGHPAITFNLFSRAADISLSLGCAFMISLPAGGWSMPARVCYLRTGILLRILLKTGRGWTALGIINGVFPHQHSWQSQLQGHFEQNCYVLAKSSGLNPFVPRNTL